MGADKQGTVKESVFFQILECTDVVLSPTDKAKLVRTHERGGKLAYVDAVRSLTLHPTL